MLDYFAAVVVIRIESSGTILVYASSRSSISADDDEDCDAEDDGLIIWAWDDSASVSYVESIVVGDLYVDTPT